MSLHTEEPAICKECGSTNEVVCEACESNKTGWPRDRNGLLKRSILMAPLCATCRREAHEGEVDEPGN
jgi:hypothetical protein